MQHRLPLFLRRATYFPQPPYFATCCNPNRTLCLTILLPFILCRFIFNSLSPLECFLETALPLIVRVLNPSAALATLLRSLSVLSFPRRRKCLELGSLRPSPNAVQPS